MDTNNIIGSILGLPERFYSLGNISMVLLLKDTGYFEMYDQINEVNILEELTKFPRYVDQWLSWSENKRSDSGWYFKQDENGKYIVGYFSTNENLHEVEYSNSIKACAVFIKNEIEEIRKS